MQSIPAEVTIYHNPRCSKSRETLSLLERRGIDPEVILYLETPINEQTITRLLQQLGFHSAHDLMRTQEELYKTLKIKENDFSEQELIQILIKHPKLIERPIVCHHQKALIGRPPERVLALFE